MTVFCTPHLRFWLLFIAVLIPQTLYGQWQPDTNGIKYSGGGVGIGRASSSYFLLDVNGSARFATRLKLSTGATQLSVYEDSDTPGWIRFRPDAGSGFYFSNNGDMPVLVVRENGRVGVGTPGPQAELDVNGTLRLSSGGDDEYIRYKQHNLYIQNEGYAHERIHLRPDLDTLGRNLNSMLRMYVSKDHEYTEKVRIYSDGTSFFNGGNVGIGTSSPSHRLSVNGEVRAKEIIVDNTGWPDFVFEDGYDLPTLEEVAAHIAQHGHLSEVPSAEDVAEYGVTVGAMQATLLQKIEELTLYAIEQQHHIQTMHVQNAQLEARLQVLEKQQ